jgi:hypothetical protein
MNEKAVVTRMAAIPGILEYLQANADTYKERTYQAVLSGQQIQSIQGAALAEHFHNLKEEIEEIILEAKSKP